MASHVTAVVKTAKKRISYYVHFVLSVSYYVNNDSPVYCTFLDATKAFDRVDCSKLFRLLIRRNVPSLILRFL